MVYYDIDYKEISKYYRGIILYILNNLSYAHFKYNSDDIPTEHTEEEYNAEYLNAYGYLQRAEWRLSEVDVMGDFYDEPDFFYFGMNNLSSARHRIQHYLEDTAWDIFDDLDYKKYDDLVMTYYQPIRLGKDGFEEYYMVSHDKWDYYWELQGIAQLKHFVKDDCEEIVDKLSKFIAYLDEVSYDKLKENQDALEVLNNETISFLISIPHVPFRDVKR